MIRGSVIFRYADREERYGTGDAYYAPPGHIPMLHAGTEIVEFSPTEELKRMIEVVQGNNQPDQG